MTTQKITKGSGQGEFSKKYSRNEFQTIINYTDQDPEHKKKLNKLDDNLCRYKDIYPYLNNSIHLSQSSHQFINASWMHIFTEKDFIASQGPNDNTVDDFLDMCFENNICGILMLCNEFEDNKKKCSNYWDQNMISSKYQFTGGQVKHQNEVIVEKIIQIQNKSTGVQMLFPHLNFKKWPDHKTPDIENYVKLFEILFNFVDTCRTNNKNQPFLVHCSAGIGRTGVFLTLYGICNEIIRQINYDDGDDVLIFNVFNFVRKLKEMRMFSVENINQYNFIYKFLEEYLREKNVYSPINGRIN